VAHWTFDEGSGTTVADAVGNYDGTLVNSVTWENGPPGLGTAVRVHNQGGNEAQSDYVTFGKGITKGPDLSVGVWMKMDAYQHVQLLGQSSGNNSTEPGWFIFPRQNGLMWFVVNGPLGGWNGGHLQLEQSGQDVWYQENEWVHLTFTFNGGTKELTGYVNAVKAHSRIINSSRSVDNCPAEMRIAQVANKANVWDAVIDELVIYDHVLTADEVPVVMEGKIVGIPQAAQPTPQDGAMNESTFAQLAWLAGLSAESHNVYIGTDAAAVERATEPTIANLTQPSLWIGLPMPGDPFPDGLQFGTTYYWRVDEVSEGHPESPWEGKVWSFTVPSKEAYDPYPADSTIQVLPDQTLSWSAGFGAQTHTVYLGTDPNEVLNADSGGKVVGETSYAATEPLTAGQTYYWRVDETSQGVLTKGAVWSFTTVPDVAVADENIVGWWKLDGPDAAVMLDSSGHGLHGEIITEGGSVEWINGAVDGAIRLDGLSDVRTIAPVAGVSSNTGLGHTPGNGPARRHAIGQRGRRHGPEDKLARGQLHGERLGCRPGPVGVCRRGGRAYASHPVPGRQGPQRSRPDTTQSGGAKQGTGDWHGRKRLCHPIHRSDGRFASLLQIADAGRDRAGHAGRHAAAGRGRV
jgi:hypothetical protein